MKLYSTHCPKCNVIEKKLKQKELNCEVIDDINTVLKFAEENNISAAPILVLDDGSTLDFAAANKYIMGL